MQARDSVRHSSRVPGLQQCKAGSVRRERVRDPRVTRVLSLSPSLWILLYLLLVIPALCWTFVPLFYVSRFL